MTAETSLYPVAFASPRQDSFTPVATSAKGAVSWAKDHGSTGRAPRTDLLFFGPAVLMIQPRSLVLFSADGERRWAVDHAPGGLAAVANGLCYFETDGLDLSAVDASGKKVIDRAALPGLISREKRLTMLWPRATDFVVAIDHFDPTYNLSDLNAKIVDPNVQAARITYGNRTPDWASQYSGVVKLPALFIPEKNRWLLGVQEVISLDISGVEPPDSDDDAPPPPPPPDPALRFALPVEKPVKWSADAAGIVVALGTAEERKAVVAFDVEGKVAWRWQDANPLDAWIAAQPPIRGPGGRVVVLTTRRALALEAGKVAWQFDRFDGAVPTWGTALADGSLLVTAGDTLRCLDAGGKPRFAVKAPAAIVSPPVVGADGAIYVATATQLVRID